MIASKAALLLAALSSLGLASAANPTKHGKRGETLIIDLQKRVDDGTAFVKRDTGVDYNAVNQHLRQLAAKYEYGMTAHESKSTSVTKGKRHGMRSEPDSQFDKRGGTAVVDMHGISDQTWYGKIKVGGQTVQVVFDTALGDVIVSKDGYAAGKQAVDTHKTVDLTWLTNKKTKGKVYQDTLQVGKLKAPKFAVIADPNVYVDEQTTGTPVQGYAGLGMSSLSHTGNTLLDSLSLSSRTFSFHLDFLGQETGKLYIGESDPLYQGGYSTSLESTHPGFWTLDGLIYQSIPTTVLFDTTTTLVVAPKDVAARYFELVGLTVTEVDGVMYGSYPCGIKNAPSMAFSFGKERNYNWNEYDWPTESFILNNDGQGNCTVDLVGADIGM